MSLINKRFALTKGLKNIHRPSRGLDLDNIFCFETTRKVNNDYTITLGATLIQLDASKEVSRPVPGSTVTIRRWLSEDGIRIFWNEQQLRFKQIKSKPKPETPTIHRPADDHPWRNLKPIGRKRYTPNGAPKRKINTAGQKVLTSNPARS